MPRTIKALVFDFDGTLADSMLTVLPVYNRVASGLGLPQIASSEIPKLRRLGPRKAIDAYQVPLWKVPLLLHQVRREMERDGSIPPLFDGLWGLFQSPAVMATRRFILSSNSRENIVRFLQRQQIDGFERIDCGAGLFGKASRLRRLLQVSRLVPAEVAYVGDELRDVEAAHEVGALSIAVSWGYAERESLLAAQPNYMVDDPVELLQIVSRLTSN